VLPALLAAALAAGSPPPAELRADVAALLGGIDRPVPAEAFRRFGPEGEAALEDIARSSDLPPRRARALEVLAALRSPRAEATHRAVAEEQGAPRTVRRVAVRGLGRLLAAEQASATLTPLLQGDRDPAVRAAAAEALARAAPARACGAIRAQAARQDAHAAARFRRAVATCDRVAPRRSP
jgi:HEAT repeat protein